MKIPMTMVLFLIAIISFAGYKQYQILNNKYNESLTIVDE